jgi:hypothetical protein
MEENGVIDGNPDPIHIRTSNVERKKPTMRMPTWRLTLLTSISSKKPENFKAAANHTSFAYPFGISRGKLKYIRAFAAGITKVFYPVGDPVEIA